MTKVDSHVVPAEGSVEGVESTWPKAMSHSTPRESAARGKAARSELPRSAHAGWEPHPRRADPIDLLGDQALTRLPELGPIRYGSHPQTSLVYTNEMQSHKATIPVFVVLTGIAAGSHSFTVSQTGGTSDENDVWNAMIVELPH